MSKGALIAVVAIVLVSSCAKHQSPVRPSPATTRATRLFDRADLGIRLTCPAGWVSHPSQDFVLLLAPAGVKPEQTWISLDVPKLPPHIPGLIPIGSVRNGYLDDLRKSVGQLETKDLLPPGVPNAAQRLVRSTATDANGVMIQETALLMVHGDGVYILRGRSAVDDEPGTRAAFDEIVKSMEWIGKK